MTIDTINVFWYNHIGGELFLWTNKYNSKEWWIINATIDNVVVESFLKTVKREIKKGNRSFVGHRNVCSNGKVISAKQALLDIGIVKIKEIWDVILNLEVSDCFRISMDYDKTRDMNSEIFEFIKVYNKLNVYIKLLINDRGVVCLSFHISNK